MMKKTMIILNPAQNRLKKKIMFLERTYSYMYLSDSSCTKFI
jgi:hypothetical protein